MDALTFALAAIVVLALLGALASAFGADSRDGFEDPRMDPPLPLVGGAR